MATCELLTKNSMERRLLQMIRAAQRKRVPQVFVVIVQPPGLVSLLIALPENRFLVDDEHAGGESMVNR